MNESQKKALVRLYQFLKEREQECINMQANRIAETLNAGAEIAYHVAADQLKFYLSMWLDIEIIDLPVTECMEAEYMEQVMEECKQDCEPDHEEREHMEEMEYRSMQMGSL